MKIAKALSDPEVTKIIKTPNCNQTKLKEVDTSMRKQLNDHSLSEINASVEPFEGLFEGKKVKRPIEERY